MVEHHRQEVMTTGPIDELRKGRLKRAIHYPRTPNFYHHSIKRVSKIRLSKEP